MGKRLTVEEWITKSEAKHGKGRYNYSQSVYVSNGDKVSIICNKCNTTFLQRAGDHSSGSGCKICSGIKNTKEKFIKQATKVHGNAYSYDKVVFSKMSENVLIICNSCGLEFNQKANNHTHGNGCPECGKGKCGSTPRLTLSTFVERSKKAHPNMYDYSDSIYVNINTPVSIKCNTCNTTFKQLPETHIKSKKCPVCQGRRKTTESFIDELMNVHSDRYLYDKVEYTGSKNKVTLTCKIHGEFRSLAGDLLKGTGCPKCADKVRVLPQTKEEFINKAVAVHGDKYDYSTVFYTNSSTKVSIYCNTCNNMFKQTPGKHVYGRGCPSCAKSGFDPNKPAVLYYLRIGLDVYKIGITNNTVEERYTSKDLAKITVINIVNYNHGADAYKAEQRVLEKYKKYKYKGEPLLYSGNTELFCKDVLNLDKD